jgi:hypothetical protein
MLAAALADCLLDLLVQIFECAEDGVVAANWTSLAHRDPKCEEVALVEEHA